MTTIFNLVDNVLYITLPEGKTMEEINNLAKDEIHNLAPNFYGKDIKINGRCTTALAMLLGHELAHICLTLSLFDPKQNDYVLVIKH